jgi:hypothetical protein
MPQSIVGGLGSARAVGQDENIALRNRQINKYHNFDFIVIVNPSPMKKLQSTINRRHV